MPINESNRPQRLTVKDQEQFMPQNSFAADYSTETVMDINNPKPVRYVHQEYPRLVYNHENGQVMQVADEKQLKSAEKKGFSVKPSPDRDYSKVTNVILNPKTEEFAAGIATSVPASAHQVLPTADDLVESA